MIRNECSDDANVIFGVAFDQELEDEMRITIIATGFTKEKNGEAKATEAAPVAAAAEEKKEAVKTTASGTIDLDDWLGNMFN